jgi:hypothetical protein
MRNRSTGFWQALEAVPGVAAVDAEWKARCGNDYGTAKAFLRPNGKLASSHPCMVHRGCGCEHEVVVHDSEDIVAVCRCERGCETFALRRSDIVAYELDRPALETELAKVFDLFEETNAGTDLPGTTHIGVYSPYAGYRFPVYLTIQIEPDDFNEAADGLLGRNGTPFILLSPTRELCSAKTEKRLTDKRSGFVSLSESVAIGDKRQFRVLRPLDEILAQFRGANLPSPKVEGATAFFPTPPDASWGDVSIRFMDGHTVSVKAKSAGGVFNYTQMGMVDKKSGNPTVQWKLLKAFADERGTMDWRSKKADRLNQKRREILATNLRKFFRINGDPFRLTDDGKGWKTLFLISPDE